MTRPIIAILRGLDPARAVATGEALLAAGIARMEVPLNSPEPLRSIAALQAALGDRAQVGAGTVLTPEEVRAVAGTGASFIVSPNADTRVIERTKQLGLASYPGVFTATECFAALAAGADALKIFPASVLGREGVTALRAVLPPATELYAVGGVGPRDFAGWRAAGIHGFGLGSALFKPDWAAERIAEAARAAVAAWDATLGLVSA